MAMLTNDQAELFHWMVEADSNRFLLIRTWGPDAFLAGVPAGERRPVNPGDLRELRDQGLLRALEGRDDGYEVTNKGWFAYEEMTSPLPPGRPPIAFHP
jgi:hypothetical protein